MRIVSAGESAVRVDVAGEHGEPVLTADRVAFRPVDPAHLEALRRRGENAPFQIDWTPVAAESSEPVRLAVLGGLAVSGERYADLEALERALAEGAAVPDVVLAEAPAGDAAEAAAG
ncbi:hypothetical protein RKE29_30015, partial [Streptomyces sp. B1866]|uniref:hypothetical protein n=1 Tax=Streptomyces sp. B1866 TaxID=3075431 RepID=UPI00288F4A0D